MASSGYYYAQQKGGEETWQPVVSGDLSAYLAEHKPLFISVLSVNKILLKGEVYDQKDLAYTGPFYADFDSTDMSISIAKSIEFVQKLADLDVDPASLRIFCTGKKGLHIEVPSPIFHEKPPAAGTKYLPYIYKDMALSVCVDTLDLRVYTGGRGRMWRAPDVERENGKFKVQITWAELQALEAEDYDALVSSPRGVLPVAAPKQALGFRILFEKARQDVTEKLDKRKKKSLNLDFLKRGVPPTLTAMLEGKGFKEGVGFHQIAMQLAIMTAEMGWSEDKLVEQAQGLCASHDGDGSRYSGHSQRENELRRMHRYVDSNPCYSFSPGAMKSLLTHRAVDLEGIPASAEDVAEDIERAAAGEVDDEYDDDFGPVDEYEDLVRGLTLTKHGLYVDTETGKKRVCAVGFNNVRILKSIETGLVSCYEADILVNGKYHGRQSLELDVFSGLQTFNKWVSKFGHAFQGVDANVRALMMKVSQLGRKSGSIDYVVSREGLDVVSLPHHEDPDMREPFLIWSDAKGVKAAPQIASKGIRFTFLGYPSPQGVMQTDLSDAPRLVEWLSTGDNKIKMKSALKNLLTCQKPDVIGKLIGWYSACFYRMLFHKAYKQFPSLHVNGAAGAGKTAMNIALLSLFYYESDPKTVSPSSSPFAINQFASGSSSIPMVLDEFKGAEMNAEVYNKLKLMVRDAYNCRDVSRGGGNRDSENYRSLHTLQLSAPMVVIAEASEDESALMERVVLVTVVKPASSVVVTWSNRFHAFNNDRKCLSVLGQYMASAIVSEYSVEKLKGEFTPMFQAAQNEYMLTAADIASDLPEEVLASKRMAKERSVYNYTVAKFGLLKFKKLLEAVYAEEFEPEFGEVFQELEASCYAKMNDLMKATIPEWAKVLTIMATQSHIDAVSAGFLRKGTHYANVTFGGKPAVALSARMCYHAYRAYCRTINTKPLFAGDHAFLHSLKDCPALMAVQQIPSLPAPGGAFILSQEDLIKSGVDMFKV